MDDCLILYLRILQRYYQTERKEIYYEWAKKLIATGRAYADPTPSETVAKYREEANKNKQAFLYRNYRPDNTPEWEIGIPLRLKAQPKAYDYHDEVFGDLHMGPETQDDIILIKADGLPTYNFAHIVDDATMGVTHVLRGQEYLPSMGNYLELYEAFGLERPKFVHLPHILAPSGNKKLGKRDGAKSANDYRLDGILPEAMLNFLACLGWNDGTEQEIYSKQDSVPVHVTTSKSFFGSTVNGFAVYSTKMPKPSTNAAKTSGQNLPSAMTTIISSKSLVLSTIASKPLATSRL